MKKIFVAATRQNDGKTTVSLGLFKALLKRDPSIQYMKPVGQQYRIVDDKKIDKDAVLFQHAFNLKKENLPLMSPIASPRGFTENYINAPRADELKESSKSLRLLVFYNMESQYENCEAPQCLLSMIRLKLHCRSLFRRWIQAGHHRTQKVMNQFEIFMEVIF